MLIKLLDADGQPHFATWQGQDQINDASGNLALTSVGAGATFQQVLAANVLRAGFLFQNTSPNAMLLNELATDTAANSWYIPPGGYFPPYAGFPIPAGAIQVIGTAASAAGDTFVCRDWQNAANE